MSHCHTSQNQCKYLHINYTAGINISRCGTRFQLYAQTFSVDQKFKHRKFQRIEFKHCHLAKWNFRPDVNITKTVDFVNRFFCLHKIAFFICFGLPMVYWNSNGSLWMLWSLVTDMLWTLFGNFKRLISLSSIELVSSYVCESEPYHVHATCITSKKHANDSRYALCVFRLWMYAMKMT